MMVTSVPAGVIQLMRRYIDISGDSNEIRVSLKHDFLQLAQHCFHKRRPLRSSVQLLVTFY